MHDIGSAQFESEPEASDVSATFGEADLEGADLETYFEADFEGSLDADFEATSDGYAGIGESAIGGLSEDEEMALAAELLEVGDEAQLDEFFGKLFRKVARGVRSFARSPAARVLGGVLKKVAKTALPVAAGALGAYVGGPAGAAIGRRVGSAAGKMFGLELEGLSPEDQEYEVARRVVRLASDAAVRAASAPPGANPVATANAALSVASRRHAPGLSRPGMGPMRRPPARGTWYRRGRAIVLRNVW